MSEIKKNRSITHKVKIDDFKLNILNTTATPMKIPYTKI